LPRPLCTWYENECVNAYEALCESLVNPEMKMYDLFEAEVEALEAKFDYEYLSCEDWLQVLTEKKLIDELLLGKISLSQVND
jgi:hypothetical protein